MLPVLFATACAWKHDAKRDLGNGTSNSWCQSCLLLNDHCRFCHPYDAGCQHPCCDTAFQLRTYELVKWIGERAVGAQQS